MSYTGMNINTYVLSLFSPLNLSLLFLFPSVHVSTEQCMGIDGVLVKLFHGLG